MMDKKLDGMDKKSEKQMREKVYFYWLVFVLAFELVAGSALH